MDDIMIGELLRSKDIRISKVGGDAWIVSRNGVQWVEHSRCKAWYRALWFLNQD